jgi:hypothetical protein
MLSVMMISIQIRLNNDPIDAGRLAVACRYQDQLGTLWRLRKIAGCVQGGTTRRTRP